MCRRYDIHVGKVKVEILVGGSTMIDTFADQNIDGKIKWILEKLSVKLRIGFSWFRLGSSRWLF